MAKKLIDKTWDDVQQEMSIAGEPDKARKFGENVSDLAVRSMDINNIPSVDNHIFALERVVAEMKYWKEMLYKRQSQNKLVCYIEPNPVCTCDAPTANNCPIHGYKSFGK